MRKGFGFHDRHSPFRFNPATLFVGGAVQGAWYDPSDLSTLFQDAAGTIPITAAGDPVGRILDKSGNGNHATQSSAASRPTFQQSNGLSYLQFDGSNDSMLTNSINFTSTDKMTVWTGVRKLSDAVAGTVVELSARSDANDGSFGVFAPGSAAPEYTFILNTVGGATFNVSSPYAAPVTNILTQICNIAGATITDELQARVNGVLGGASSGGVGTGNFGNYPLFIGRRNNTSFPFNGRLYGLIVLGAAASSWQIRVTEQWMAGKTGLQF